MQQRDRDIESAAHAFAEAGRALGELMLTRLEADAPETAAKAQQAIQAGERMQIVLELDIGAPMIVWQVVDDYDRPKRLMSMPARMLQRQ